MPRGTRLPPWVHLRIRQLIRAGYSSNAVVEQLWVEDSLKVHYNTVYRVKKQLSLHPQSVGSRVSASTASHDVGPSGFGSGQESRKGTKPTTDHPGYVFFSHIFDQHNRLRPQSRLRDRVWLWETQTAQEKAMWVEKKDLREELRRQAMKTLELAGTFESLIMRHKRRIYDIVHPQMDTENLFGKLREYEKRVFSTLDVRHPNRQSAIELDVDEDYDPEETLSTCSDHGEENDNRDVTDEVTNSVAISRQRSDELSLEKVTDGSNNSGQPRPHATAASGAPPSTSARDADLPANKIARIISHATTLDDRYMFQVTWTGKPETVTAWLSPSEMPISIIALKGYLDRAGLDLDVEVKNNCLTLTKALSSAKTVEMNRASRAGKRLYYGDDEEELSQEGSAKDWPSKVMCSGQRKFGTSYQSSASSMSPPIGQSIASNARISGAAIANAGSPVRAKETSKSPPVESAMVSKQARVSQSEVASRRRSFSPEISIVYPQSSAAKSSLIRQGPVAGNRAVSRNSGRSSRPESDPVAVPSLPTTPAAKASDFPTPILSRGNSGSNTANGPSVASGSGMANEPLKMASGDVPEAKKIIGGPCVSMAKNAARITEDFVFEDPAELNRPTGFQLGWIPDRIVGVVPDSYPKRYMVKWEANRVVEPVEKAVLMEKAPKMFINFLESHM